MSSSEPSKWTTALGASADVNVIPATTPAGTGLASMSSLFPAITQVPIDAGGIAPERADFNALFKMLGDQSYFLQQGGVYSYSASYPYSAGDLVRYNCDLYLCIQAHASGAATPSNTSYWRKLATSEIHSQSVSGPDGWVRFKSGIQIVFSSGGSDEVVNFPVAFIAAPRLVMTSPTTGGTYVGVPGWYERTTTYFKGNVYDPVDHEFISDGHFDFIAIGFWK